MDYYLLSFSLVCLLVRLLSAQENAADQIESTETTASTQNVEGTTLILDESSPADREEGITGEAGTTNMPTQHQSATATTNCPVSASMPNLLVPCGQPAITPCLPMPSSNSQCNNRIHGGREALRNSYPWQVALLIEEGAYLCGGSIVHQEWIITAAHCVYGKPAGSVKVHAGVHNIQQETNELSVSEIISHPNYNSGNSDYDIALLKLSTSIVYNDYISPVCVAKPSDAEVGITTPVVATGWGAMSDGRTAAVLQEVQLALTSTASCNTAYSGRITAQMICAGGPGKDTCQGDSGGPLVYRNPHTQRFTLVGATSFGIGCANPKYPGVYAKVSAFYSWFSQYIPNI